MASLLSWNGRWYLAFSELSIVFLPLEECEVWLFFQPVGFYPFLFLSCSFWLSSSAYRPVQYSTDLVGSLALVWEMEGKETNCPC